MLLQRRAAIGHHDQAQFVEILTALTQALLKEYFVPLRVGWRGHSVSNLGYVHTLAVPGMERPVLWNPEKAASWICPLS